MLFDSKDEDFKSRILTPITITSMNSTAVNVLNTVMDHGWDGLYTSLLRLSRFPALIEGGKRKFYSIDYKSTPPQN